MKHIFMGKIEYKKYYADTYYYNKKEDDYDSFVPPLRYMFGLIKEIEDYPDSVTIQKDIQKYDIKANLQNDCIKTEYKSFGKSSNIEERILKNSYINIQGERLYVNEVEQCDNGEVLCYTNKLLKEVVDEKSKEKAIEFIKILEEIKSKNNIDESNDKCKKWWKFWK